jgi:hypothetical protein
MRRDDRRKVELLNLMTLHPWEGYVVKLRINLFPSCHPAKAEPHSRQAKDN